MNLCEVGRLNQPRIIVFVVKEALTKVLKQAQATEVHMRAKADAQPSEFVGQDDDRKNPTFRWRDSRRDFNWVNRWD